MIHLIDKSAVVAEIEKFIKKNELYLDDNASDEVRFQKIGAYSVLCDLRHFLDTLEVKEVQEEPVSIWHDASEKPNIKEKSGIFVITSLNGEYIGSRYYNYNDVTINFGNYDKWAYLDDILKI